MEGLPGSVVKLANHSGIDPESVRLVADDRLLLKVLDSGFRRNDENR